MRLKSELGLSPAFSRLCWQAVSLLCVAIPVSVKWGWWWSTCSSCFSGHLGKPFEILIRVTFNTVLPLYGPGFFVSDLVIITLKNLTATLRAKCCDYSHFAHEPQEG